MAPAERRRGATLALPLLLAVGLYGLFYVGLDVRTAPLVNLSTPVPAVQALRTQAGQIRGADAWQARSNAGAAVQPRVQPRISDAEAPAPAPEAEEPSASVRERPLLSQRTPAWDRLLKEGLFHKNSGYPRIEPQNADEAAEKNFWEDRMAHEFRDGACWSVGATRLAAYARDCRLPSSLEQHQAVPAAADHHWAGTLCANTLWLRR